MNKKTVELVNEQLRVLVGQPLQYVHRSADLVTIGIGEMMAFDHRILGKDEDGHLLKGKKELAKYALHIQARFRFSMGDNILIASSQIFQPTHAVTTAASFDFSTFPWESFDYDVQGGNRFDEFASSFFTKNSPVQFVVQNVSVNALGDLKVQFTEHLCLEVFSDTAEQDENWRFFENGNSKANHLVITGTDLDLSESCTDE